MTWQAYFRERADAFPFTPWVFEGEDLNLRAFRSKEAFIEWYAQTPGPIGNPYRDEGFYVRELTELSMRFKPKRILEFGTSLGIGALLFAMLNPSAEIITVDNRATQYLPGNIEIETGYLSKMMKAQVEYALNESGTFAWSKVDLCFIDADHSYEAVKADSERAWVNRNIPGCIVWHDYNSRHPGVMHAAGLFAHSKGLTLQRKPDSSTAWVEF